MTSQRLIDLVRRFPSEEIDREDRIHNEIIVDAYEEEEVASSWYYYLEDKLNFPFEAMVQTHLKHYPNNSTAHCASRIQVLGLASLERCSSRHIWVMGILSTSGSEMPIHILLTDVVSVDADETREAALTDWMYWNRNHDFGIWELK